MLSYFAVSKHIGGHMTIRIRCINKSGGYHENQHEAIEFFGWVDDANPNNCGRSNLAQIVKYLEEGNYAYVSSYGTKAYCYVRTSSRGLKFVQTYADQTPTDNLLQLPECG